MYACTDDRDFVSEDHGFRIQIVCGIRDSLSCIPDSIQNPGTLLHMQKLHEFGK